MKAVQCAQPAAGNERHDRTVKHNDRLLVVPIGDEMPAALASDPLRVDGCGMYDELSFALFQCCSQRTGKKKTASYLFLLFFKASKVT